MGKVGILLPARNEEKTIGIIIKEAKRSLPKSEIIVVDDGSTDRTSNTSSGMGVKVLRHETNYGKGRALITGFDYFIKRPIDYLIVSDTDGQYKISDAIKIIEALENNKGDFITGYRNPNDIPYANRMGNFIWRTLFNFFYHTKFKDTNCGFIGLNKKALKKIKSFEGGYNIDNSMLAESVRKKLRVYQVPVKVYYGKRKIRKFARMFFTVLFFILLKGAKHKHKRLFK